jgi:hypothetical protein
MIPELVYENINGKYPFLSVFKKLARAGGSKVITYRTHMALEKLLNIEITCKERRIQPFLDPGFVPEKPHTFKSPREGGGCF